MDTDAKKKRKDSDAPRDKEAIGHSLSITGKSTAEIVDDISLDMSNRGLVDENMIIINTSTENDIDRHARGINDSSLGHSSGQRTSMCYTIFIIIVGCFLIIEVIRQSQISSDKVKKDYGLVPSSPLSTWEDNPYISQQHGSPPSAQETASFKREGEKNSNENENTGNENNEMQKMQMQLAETTNGTSKNNLAKGELVKDNILPIVISSSVFSIILFCTCYYHSTNAINSSNIIKPFSLGSASGSSEDVRVLRADSTLGRSLDNVKALWFAASQPRGISEPTEAHRAWAEATIQSRSQYLRSPRASQSSTSSPRINHLSSD